MQDANFAAEHLWKLPDGNERQEIRVLVQKYVENDDVIYDLPKATKLRLLWDFSSEFAMLKLLQDEEEIKASALQRIADYEEDFWSTEFDLKLLESHLRNLLLEEKHHSAASTQLTRALDYINRTGALERQEALITLQEYLGSLKDRNRTQNLTQKIRAVKKTFHLKRIIQRGKIQKNAEAGFAVEWFLYLPGADEREKIRALVRTYLEEDEARIDELSKEAKVSLLSHFVSELAMWKLLRDEDEEVKKVALKRIEDHDEAYWGEGFDLKLLEYLPNLLLDKKYHLKAFVNLMKALQYINRTGLPEKIQALEELQKVLEEKLKSSDQTTANYMADDTSMADDTTFLLEKAKEMISKGIKNIQGKST